MLKPVYLFVLSVSILLTACGGKQRPPTPSLSSAVEIRHATLFRIEQNADYTLVAVANPWQRGAEYARYYLVNNDTATVPSDGVRIQIPLRTLMVNSTTHIGFLDLLDEIDPVVGVCDAPRIYHPLLRERIAADSVMDLGDSFRLDIERLLLLHPDAVMTTAYNADDENTRKLRQTGIPVLYNVEWQESSVLGRAEWIKFVGAFFDKLPLADSLFNRIEQRYDLVRAAVAADLTTDAPRPTVLSGQDFRGSWSMPGGQSFSAELIRDAGGSYRYADNDSRGSIQLSMEEALLYFGSADLWIGAQAKTLDELSRTNAQYGLFRAFRTKNVYNYDRLTTSTGGNDYWESGIARPDLLLSDLAKALHPSLLPDYSFTYMLPLE
jgi:iron complex transport system substrate-binding protein